MLFRNDPDGEVSGASRSNTVGYGAMLEHYYANPSVRARLLEFMGGASLEQATCVFITADDRSPDVQFVPRPVGELWRCLDEGLDIGRSLWDRTSLIAHLDIEYVNFDYPGEPYLEPARTFNVQRPVAVAVQELLLGYGIVPLHVMSGRGHHFVWRIRRDSTAFAVLAWLGRVPETLAARYAQPQPPTGETVDSELGAAFAGLGLVLEFLAHSVLQCTLHDCAIPVELTAVEVGPDGRGREMVSIDLSEYGDPLHTRGIRIPFSAYLKPHQQCWAIGESVVEQLPPMFNIPMHELDEMQALLVMRDVGQVVELARRASIRIPDQSEGMEPLIADYQQSRLAQFHDQFYSAEHDPPSAWPDTYDRTPLEPLPPCARLILQQPNELLLKPAALQHIARILLAVGWHPRHIAGLIRSKYERDYGWGDMWYRYDASTRADFYVRLFSGLFAVGLDALIDFNCKSTQEKGYCATPDCNFNLLEYRSPLLARRTREEQNCQATGSSMICRAP